MANVDGHCDPRFDQLKATLEAQLSSGNELGAAIAINIDGKNVVDIWGGYTDEAQTQPWTRDTITNVWSSTKTVASLAALIQISRGKLDPNAPVAKYWPEFAQNGKDKVLIRHILSHTSGVSGWEGPITWEEVYGPSSVERLAEQAPWWEPGTASGYHSNNMGHLIGEVIRRTSGKSMKQFVAEEIAGPLGADFQIGAQEKDWPRIAPIIPPPPLPIDFSKMDPNSVPVKTFGNPTPDATRANTADWRRADMAALNGHGNARSLVRMLSTITLGGVVDGVTLLSPETIDLIFQKQADGTDLVVGIPSTFGVGFGLTEGAITQTAPWLPKGRVCFWAGWGGSIIIMDLDRKVTFSYVMQKMGSGIVGSERTEEYLSAAYKALGVDGY
ncbi:hypothetical protein LTR10_020326 [Elasticomyces elasticus]|uniref:Beta-lactamase-related domain-containing protein n=1 Tax=Exophiala sideris TaxID=1016849 RepID=A0ABR0J7L4_9EURO|nr:hypothetical protein LTR10_020326 [Elasticomyces elasticus]KAK5029983.1 hypothetical protein LTS07_005707 [Exophiala sideris]KAK5031578.1 hypothetical protein LTR13_007567 [Exophiala sideris]KAK5058255.1 hypothetical protein LTR69_006659 [Exophiala sideris]KAK5180185.1 hypothetical protein LTR44_007310 [Eurotiomycetes sp. CCFEE 6388]